MSRWLIANLNRGELDGHRILKAKSYDLLWKPSTDLDIESEFNAFQQHFKQFSPVTHGINWYLGEFQGHRVVFHAGGDTGFRSFEILLPDDLIGVVIASNWDHTASEIVDIILKSE
jgi:CubicO group peptidase (beta-lactamase class C family)